MANGRNKTRKGDASRMSGRFIALPFSMVGSAAFMGLTHPAKALLIDIAGQYMGNNNGRLLAGLGYLRKRGWTSSDVLYRALRQLIDVGLIYQTVQGQRPNRASWYAITWMSLDSSTQYDAGAEAGFKRGKFMDRENTALNPGGGLERPAIGS